jgi:hypothetical protein
LHTDLRQAGSCPVELKWSTVLVLWLLFIICIINIIIVIV